MNVQPSPLLRLIAKYRPPICQQCARKYAFTSSALPRRRLSTTSAANQGAATQLGNRYFLSNSFRLQSNDSNGATESKRNTAAPITQGLDSRTRGDSASITRLDQEKEDVGNIRLDDVLATDKGTPASHTKPRRRGRLKPASNVEEGALEPLPLDASSTLSALASAAPAMSLKRRLAAYLALTKPRLAFLIVLTTTASYSLYPVPSLLSASATHTPSLSTLTLFFLTAGTFSVIASANTLNMLLEPAYDAQMSRTRNRPLVRGLIKTRSAIMFAIGSAVLGTGILWYGVNPTTSVLGATNIVLYAFIYTPMKRISVLNTWVGAVVGAAPPLMGWCAAGGHYMSAPTGLEVSGTLASLLEESKELLLRPEAMGGWLIAALLFAWQFPHFNALSYPIRHEYKNAGYKMCVSFYPALNTRVALRYSVLMFPICFGLTYVGVTDQGFLVTSSAINGWMMREAIRFWKTGGGEGAEAAKAARGLFWASVWHLPLVLVLAMAHKKGLWEGVWRSIVGEEGLDDEWDEEE
ncbi:hypothetical protein MBLNU457_4695t1 [Dothideomycetes sp. NU457]